MYSYRQGDNEQKIKPFFLLYIAFTILFPLLFAALVSGLTNPKRLLPTNGNGKKRGEQRQSGTPDRRKNWKLKAAASRSGPGNTLEVESRKTRVHTLHPQAARLAARERPSVCVISAGGGGGHLPGPPARPPSRDPGTTGFGGQVRARRGPESVPLGQISPVRNALRPRRLPAALALGSRPLARPGQRRGEFQHRRGRGPHASGTAAHASRPRSKARAAPRIPRVPKGGARPPPYLSSSGRRASRPHPAEAPALREDGGRPGPQPRRGTVSARARATGGSVAAGRFPELPSVTPAGPTQPGTSTATAILPRPRPCWPRPHLPLRPRPAWPRPVRTLRPDVTPSPAPPPLPVASGTRWFVGSRTFASRRALSPGAPRTLGRATPFWSPGPLLARVGDGGSHAPGGARP